ncbi:conserved hypothetical protein [Hymenobacter roseosalivarius DSM 11622]|uniref:DUF4394 domain-containing protein n=1 Tax=Hymenobacter roseosalivarius DSM 11622 TaxID=645990 RepID=A0A1W1W3J7_9BACT|nr:DUF4394 domain-containing protein [Hymenobacter roseosalivarius]SMC00205.1 conserved hypothetical protein [Hymenobacter roseosalivarius DSM 11622]
MLKTSSLAKWGVAVLLMSSLSSCEDILEQYFPKPTPTPPAIPTFPPLGQDIAFYALSGGNRLDAYSTANAATRTNSLSITGLASGEMLLAIDFRPATGQLYGISNGSRLYLINQNTGAARAIGAGAFMPAVSGNLVGFDFNPTVDRIRLVTSTGQNLRLNPETGTVAATDGVINGAAGTILSGAAYSNNVPLATSTALYAIDAAAKQLYLVNPPNNGTVVAVGNLNLNITGDGGFDIDAKTGTALGLYPVNGQPTLFTIDLSTGAARPLAQYSASLGYTGIAIPTRPVIYTSRFNVGIRGEHWSDLVIVDPTRITRYGGARITGLGFDDIIDIDFRPATGQLYALTTTDTEPNVARLYTIDLGTYAATLVATLFPIEQVPDRPAYSMDFNPVTDRLRIVSTFGQNLRVNPVDGTVVEDERLNPSNQAIFGVAYTNSTVGATTTDLYAVGFDRSNSATNSISKLYRQNPPNAGTLTEIGLISSEERRGIYELDISGTSNTGYAIGENGRNSRSLYTIDLATGRATESTVLGIFDPQTNGLAVGPGF